MASPQPKFIVALAMAGLAALLAVAYVANRPDNRSDNRSDNRPAAAGPGKAPAGFPEAPPVAVELARVAAANFLDEASAIGTLKSAETVLLRPEVAGRIQALHFRDGAAVDRGALLIELDAAIPAAELQQARANLSLARANHERSQELLARKFISQQALDSAAATLAVQSAAVELAAARLARTRIRAPFAGVVGLRNVSVGDVVKEGQELVNLEDIRVLRVDFKLPETLLTRISSGLAVTVTSDALPGETFAATVDAVDPLVDPGGRAVSVRARLGNAAGRLRPGMFVRVRLSFGERREVLMIPEQAVIPGSVPAVFRIEDGQARRVPVRLGVRREAQVEVREGLAAGDRVVTAGQLKLRDGAAVRPLGDAAEAPSSGHR